MTKEAFLSRYQDLQIREQNLLSRAYDTLQNNVFEKGTYPWGNNRCVSPGMGTFRGIWNWDSAFHAIGLARFDKDLAEESIFGFLQFIEKDGMLPDVIKTDGEILSGYSKPPVFAWACKTVYDRTKDLRFLEKVYPTLIKNEFFWRNKRFDDTLFFYDADKKAEDYDLHVRYESGWDNSPRWDTPIYKKYPIDLNCFMVMTYRALAEIADLIGNKYDVPLWMAKEKSLVHNINSLLWDEEKSIYADAEKEPHRISEVLTPASFMPLYVGIANEKQAHAMAKLAKDESKFDSAMPTVTYDSPAFSTDYWRGPIWLNTAYFAAKGLKNYGFPVADEIKENILAMCDANSDGIFENYDAQTGKGLCCDHFSWSAVFLMEFILNF